MLRSFWKIFFIGMLLLPVTSCFLLRKGIDTQGSVEAYENGIVKTNGGRFRVGVLSPEWKPVKVEYRALVFNNARQSSSIALDSFCRKSFDDGPLNVLTNQLFYGITDQHRISQSKVKLDGREALRTVLAGDMDGSPVKLDVVVLKMNRCVFDFYFIANPGTYGQGVQDFERFFRGFQYLEGPEILTNL